MICSVGLGKTFVASEKMKQLNKKINLVICQKSKVDDWVDHFAKYYDYYVCDLTNSKEFTNFTSLCDYYKNMCFHDDKGVIGVINYELTFRRKDLQKLINFTLICDESGLLTNENAKRTKAIMQLNYENLILLSGTICGGKYETLYSQLNMLGYNITKKAFYNMYVDYHYEDNEGFPVMIIDGYKNVERLKRKMAQLGCVFMKSDEVFDLPEQTFIDIKINPSKEYRTFKKDKIVKIHNVKIVGDTILNKMLGERQLCGAYNTDKLEAFADLIESTNDRLIVFYNFNAELNALMQIAKDCERQISIVNGECKDMNAYENCENAITFIQYQAGAMGLNLQKANKIVYFTPPLSSELYEQSKKRIHRIGQQMPCFYYRLVCKSSIEQKIYKTLEMRKDYTDKLFEKEGN